MTITYYPEMIQGSDEWVAARCGVLTASEMDRIITPTLKMANSEKERLHLFELMAQRITGYVEPHYVSDDMLRGREDEIEARTLYAEKYADVTEVGFVTNDALGFLLGFSPDALVGDDGFIECKGRLQKYQVQTIVANEVPSDYMIQIQTGLLVTQRKWCDFVQYCGGLPMITIRVEPLEEYQVAIRTAASMFEARLHEKLVAYHEALHSDGYRLTAPTKRRITADITL